MASFVKLPPVPDARDSLFYVLDAWERDWLVAERGLSPNTVLAYTSDMRDFASFLEAIGIATFSDVETGDVQAWVAALAERRLSPSSFRARICALRDFWRFLGAFGIADAGVLPDIPVPKKHPSHERPLDEDEEIALWATYDTSTPIHERDRAEFALMDDLGLRESEVSGLNLEDIRVRDEDIWVNGKGDKPRLIPIAEDTLELVVHYVRYARPRLKCRKAPQDEHALFLNAHGGRITRQAIWQSVAAHGRSAGIDHLHPHQLRRTFASRMYRNDMDLRALQLMLGHADLATTGIYITPEAADLHDRYDEAVVKYWDISAEKADRRAVASPTDETRDYWISIAKFDRERAAFERGLAQDIPAV